MNEIGHTPDMFYPPHIAFLKEAEHNFAIAAPYQAKGHELRKKAYALCPHDEIINDLVFHEDEYGSTMSSWTEVEVTCSFCGKRKCMNRDEFNKSNLSYWGLLNDSNRKN